MSNTFEEMMKCYLEVYMNSEEGQKTMQKAMLKSMIHMLNGKNHDQLTSLFNQNKINKITFDKLKHIIDEFEKLSSPESYFLTTEKIKILHDAVIQIFNLLNKIEIEVMTYNTINNRIDNIYQSVSALNLKPRTLSREEFLGMSSNESNDNKNTDKKSTITPPERAEISKLKEHGYSVAWNSPLSNKKRQELLKHLIETNKVSKGYVISYLKHNIQINGKKESNEFAVSKWKDDLEFVYNL